jgi:hypothetical protein
MLKTHPVSGESRVFLVLLFHKLHKSLFVYKSRILPIMQNAEIAQAKFDEALVNKIYGGVDVQGKGRL